MAKPMERLNAYTTPNNQGGVTVDIDGMALDLVTACKMHPDVQKDPAGNKDKWLAWLSTMWDDCHVEVTLPTDPGPAPADGSFRRKLDS